MAQKISPFLWFEDKAKEAMEYYVEVFNSAPHADGLSKISHIEYYPEGSEEEHLKGMEGKVLTGVFELAGNQYICLDGGPDVFKFSGAISFLVDCQDQAEVDHFWEKLSAVPESEQCGWCTDKYGITWQIVPKQLGELLSSPDKDKSAKAMHAMMQMKKLDIAKLEAAANS
jgi:predicted 3-demethylubiquinone-9 3-methyltransferase (glyoxalase superfamily)